MLWSLRSRVVACLRNASGGARDALRDATRPAPIVGGLIRDTFRTRSELLAENALLRQQLVVASRQVKRPACRPYERGIIVALSSRLEHWRSAVFLVKPETVLRWHREGFRCSGSVARDRRNGPNLACRKRPAGSFAKWPLTTAHGALSAFEASC